MNLKKRFADKCINIEIMVDQINILVKAFEDLGLLDLEPLCTSPLSTQKIAEHYMYESKIKR